MAAGKHVAARASIGVARAFAKACSNVALAVSLALGCIAAGEAAARGSSLDPSRLCDAAASIAARETGVPEGVLRALTRTETGRGRNGRLEPWPWTVNMEGEGRWFDQRADAVSFVERRRREGARSFDVGCFQINHRWHGDAFASIGEMFDPIENARYAARFLRELRDELSAASGDWLRIAGAYHSRTPHFADIYKARFARIFDALDGGDVFGLDAASSFAASAPVFASAGGSLAVPGRNRGADASSGGVALAFARGARSLLRASSGPLNGQLPENERRK